MSTVNNEAKWIRVTPWQDEPDLILDEGKFNNLKGSDDDRSFLDFVAEIVHEGNAYLGGNQFFYSI